MKCYRHILTAAVVLALSSITAAAQSYRGQQWLAVARQLGIADSLAAVAADTTVLVAAADGRPVAVRTSPRAVVEHIGLPLFNADMRALMPSPVYDCLEFALLNRHYKVNPNTLYLSKVIFRHGSWDTMLREPLRELPYTVSCQDGKLYVVSWQSPDGQPVVTVGVPVDYELLANDRRRNMERCLVDYLAEVAADDTADATGPSATAGTVGEGDLKIYGTEGLFVRQRQWHLMPELNQDTYYTLTDATPRRRRATADAVVPTLVVSRDHPAETLANLLLSDDDTPPVALALDFHLSDYSRRQVDVSGATLRRFFAAEGCQLYYAPTLTTDSVQRGMLLVYNADRGYNHLLSVSAPLGELTADAPRLQVAAYLYIPHIDKESLFGRTPTRKSGANIYQ